MEYWTSSFLTICITRAIHVCKAVALNHWNSGTLSLSPSLTDPLTGFVSCLGERRVNGKARGGAMLSDINFWRHHRRHYRPLQNVCSRTCKFFFPNRDCEITTYVTMKQSQQKGKLGIQDWKLWFSSFFLLIFFLSCLLYVILHILRFLDPFRIRDAQGGQFFPLFSVCCQCRQIHRRSQDFLWECIFSLKSWRPFLVVAPKAQAKTTIWTNPTLPKFPPPSKKMS